MNYIFQFYLSKVDEKSYLFGRQIHKILRKSEESIFQFLFHSFAIKILSPFVIK